MIISYLCLFLAITFTGAAQKNAKPNILIILTDDQGYHDVSYYGTPDLRTPNIDTLCKAGMRFDNFYVNSPVCSPTSFTINSASLIKYSRFVTAPREPRPPVAPSRE